MPMPCCGSATRAWSSRLHRVRTGRRRPRSPSEAVVGPSAGRNAFPLVPRSRGSGLPFGFARSTRRGRGSDLAGFREYVPGDPVSTIDWRASARLSTALGDDEFVVRERYADEAPRVVVVADRSPSMGLYPDWSPWLSKPGAARAATRAIVESALAARAAVGYLGTATS